jgi:glutaredoxin 3
MGFFSRTIRPILNHIPNPFAATASTSSGLTTHPAMASAKELVEKTIDENFVAFFSKSWCPYCRRAKGVINELNLGEEKQVKIYECVPPRFLVRKAAVGAHLACSRLDTRDDGDAIQDYLLQKTGQRSVPNIFIS